MARFQLESGPIPLHHQVYLDLRSALDSGEWAVGDRLPAERDLAQRYGCSLITVRHALGELAREGRLERTRGRGTFVLPPRIDHNFAGTLSFTAEMRRRGLSPRTTIVAKRTEPAGATDARILDVEPGSSLVYVERLRTVEGEPVLLEQARLPERRFPGLLDVDLETHSLYDVLAERYRTPVARASETVEPVRLPAREAELLGVAARTLALLLIGVAFDGFGTPVERSQSFIRSDRTRYRIERAVNRPNWLRSLELPHVVADVATAPVGPDGGG